MPTDESRTLQAALLPAVPERMGSLRVSVAHRPAEGPAAGGDFYDAFMLEDGRVALIVGDISGHGSSALPQTALLRYTLRAFLDSGMPPRGALGAAGAALDHQLHGCFGTVVLALLDPRERTLTYACAGHPPPVVLAPERVDPILAAASPPIGAGLATGRRQTALWLPGGALVCLFTDGLVDARAGDGLFGPARLARAMAALGPEDHASDLLEHVIASTHTRRDDMAACLVRLDPPPGAAAPRALRRPVRLCEELEVDGPELACPRPERFLTACGLPPERVEEALRAAQLVVDCTGAAVLRVTRQPAGAAPGQRAGSEPAAEDPAVEVSPRTIKVLNLLALDRRRREAEGAPCAPPTLATEVAR
jgi:hypothetical protein